MSHHFEEEQKLKQFDGSRFELACRSLLLHAHKVGSIAVGLRTTRTATTRSCVLTKT